MSAAQAEPGWIGGRRFDLFFFFGSSALAVLLGLVVVAAPILVVPLWWLWTWLVDGPHVVATWARTYLDAGERRARRGLLLGSLLFLLPGPLALGASKLTGSPAPFDLFMLVAALWAYHHAVRQHYGVLSIYERLAGSSPADRRIDTLFLQLAMWALFALFLLAFPLNRATLSLPAELPAAARAGVTALAAALGVAGLAYAGLLVARARSGRSIRPGLFALLPVLGMSALAYFVVGAFEPLMKGPQNPEQNFLAVGIVGGMVHGLQYLGIVFAANRRRYSPEAAGPRAAERSIAATLGRAPRVAFLCFTVVSLGYLILSAARGAPGASFYGEGSDGMRLFLGIYWGMFFHHYYIDQKIWKPHQDPALRFELGLGPSPGGAAAVRPS
jgi:hypothetical protein